MDEKQANDIFNNYNSLVQTYPLAENKIYNHMLIALYELAEPEETSCDYDAQAFSRVVKYLQHKMDPVKVIKIIQYDLHEPIEVVSILYLAGWEIDFIIKCLAQLAWPDSLIIEAIFEGIKRVTNNSNYIYQVFQSLQKAEWGISRYVNFLPPDLIEEDLYILYSKNILCKSQMVLLVQTLFYNHKGDWIDEDDYVYLLKEFDFSPEEINKLLPADLFSENLTKLKAGK